MSDYSITDIEDAILTTLQAVTALDGVRTWKVFADTRESTWKSLILRYPAIGVVSTRATYDHSMPTVQDEHARFLVICIARNLRSPSNALRGDDAGELGVWDMVDAVRAALFGSTLGGLDLIDCLPIKRELMMSGSDWAAASVEVAVTWRHTGG